MKPFFVAEKKFVLFCIFRFLLLLLHLNVHQECFNVHQNLRYALVVNKENMGQILRDMTAQERAFYEEDCKKFPWLKTIKMKDDEFLACLERDLGKGMVAIYFHRLWNRHYSWVVLAILKHFYETGEFVHYDWDYTDGQMDSTIQQIMTAWGADTQTENDVLDCRSKFDFTKHKTPTNVPPYDRTKSKQLGFDNIFDEYYESHGFKNPF